MLADLVVNVFCRTGPGGGIRPNCSAHSDVGGGTGSGKPHEEEAKAIVAKGGKPLDNILKARAQATGEKVSALKKPNRVVEEVRKVLESSAVAKKSADEGIALTKARMAELPPPPPVVSREAAAPGGGGRSKMNWRG